MRLWDAWADSPRRLIRQYGKSVAAAAVSSSGKIAVAGGLAAHILRTRAPVDCSHG